MFRMDIQTKADEEGIPNYLVANEQNTLTVIGMGPVSNDQVKAITGKLGLL